MLRTLEVGYDHKSIKTFAKAATAETKARELAALCAGMVNARIVPVEVDGAIRYTALFYAFSEQADVVRVAHGGYICHR